MENKSYHPALYWVHLYGYIVLAAAIYGILAAHIPVILGHQWTVVLIDGEVSLPVILTLHLYDASLTFFTMWFSWYSIKKVTLKNIRQYQALLMSVIAAEFAFFTFECEELLWNFHDHAQPWENYLIGSIATILVCGAFFGIYVLTKVISLTQE